MTLKIGHRALVALLAGVLLAAAPVFAQASIDPFGAPILQVRPQPSYYVWVDQGGWHVRWATAFPQLFSGIVTSDGVIQNPRRAGGGSLSWLSSSGTQRMTFATVAFTGLDGFDFESTGAHVTFSLLMNASPARPGLVFVGRNHLNPPGMPFLLVANPLLVQQTQGTGSEGRLSDINRAVDRDR